MQASELIIRAITADYLIMIANMQVPMDDNIDQYLKNNDVRK